MADFWSFLFLQPSGVWMEWSDHCYGSGQLCSPTAVSNRDFLTDLPWSKALRSNWAIINLNLKCQITVKGETAGELKGRSSVSCRRTPVNIPTAVLCSCPQGELHWSVGIMQFSGKDSWELVGNPLFTLLWPHQDWALSVKGLGASFIQTPFLRMCRSADSNTF